MGVSGCGDFESLGAKPTFAILYSCYAAFQNWEGLEDVTIEDEEANARWQEVVAYHEQLISQASE